MPREQKTRIIRVSRSLDQVYGAVTRQLEPGELDSLEVWRGLLGAKVSLRYRIHDDPRHQFSEAIGVVSSVAPSGEGAASLTIVNRRGEESKMALTDILAAKAF